MRYTVIRDFTDLQDNNFKYRVGDEFPRPGMKVSDERIDELSTTKNRRGLPMIEEVIEEEPKEEPVIEEPEQVEEPVEEPKEAPKPKRGRKKKNAD